MANSRAFVEHKLCFWWLSAKKESLPNVAFTVIRAGTTGIKKPAIGGLSLDWSLRSLSYNCSGSHFTLQGESADKYRQKQVNALCGKPFNLIKKNNSAGDNWARPYSKVANLHRWHANNEFCNLNHFLIRNTFHNRLNVLLSRSCLSEAVSQLLMNNLNVMRENPEYFQTESRPNHGTLAVNFVRTEFVD